MARVPRKSPSLFERAGGGALALPEAAAVTASMLPSVAQSRAASDPNEDLSTTRVLMAEKNPTVPEIKKPGGFFDRIGDFITSDEGRATLLRSGAATINGGIGAGIEAGAKFADERKGLMAAREQALAELGLKQQGLDQQGQHYDNNFQLGLMGEGNKSTANDIAAWVARATAANRVQQIEQDDTNNVRNNTTQQRGQDLSYGATTRGQDISRDTAVRGQDATNWRHTTPSASGGGANSGPNFSYQVPGAPATTTGGFLGMGGTPVPAVPKVNVSGKAPPPSPESVRMLKDNPALAGQFDAQFGRGTASIYLRR